MRQFSTYKGKNRRGFTLLELTIVLLAMVSIIGAIWVAAEKTWDSYRVYRANQQVAEIVQNVREHYGTTIQTWPPTWPAGTDITTGTPGGLASLDSLNLFPREMRRNPTAGAGNTPIDHAINNTVGGGAPAWGSFHVLTEQDPFTNFLNTFRVSLQGLTQGSCIKLLMTAPLTDATIGIVRVGTTVSSATINNGRSGTPNVTPMQVSTAKKWCAVIYQVDLDFKLHN